MKKAVSVVVSLLAGLLVAVVATAGPGKAAPDIVTIDTCKVKKSAVVMNHKLHVDKKIACTDCHHTNKDLKAGVDQEVKKCSACHLKPEKPETLNCTDMGLKKNAFHVNCIDCHKKDAAKKAPTKCDDCHKK
jgi:hypothetical protein